MISSIAVSRELEDCPLLGEEVFIMKEKKKIVVILLIR
jgi:hypothetical protein